MGPRPKRLLILTGALALLAAGLGVMLYVFYGGPSAPRKLTPITRDELTQALRRDALDGLAPSDRMGKLVEYGHRLGMAGKEQRAALYTDPKVWEACFALSGEERAAFIVGAVFAQQVAEEQAMDDFFRAPPEKQQELLDDRIDLALMVSLTSKGMQRLGIVPKPHEQRRQIKDSFAQFDQRGRNQFLRGLLNLSNSRQRAVFEEFRRRVVKRASERGIDYVKLERGETSRGNDE